MSGKINMGVLGTGRIAATMAETVGKMKNIKCYAVASRTAEKAQAFGEKHSIKKCYGSYEEMLQDKKIDLVYIATPHSEHYENMKLCIKYGKGILCEKAFTANAAQAEEIIRLAEEKGVFLTEAIWTRYMPMLDTIREVLASGVIGEVKMLTANLGYPLDSVERMNNPALAGGALLDLGVYPINFASMILGTDVEKITSSCTYTDSGVDRQNSITLTYGNGNMAVLCSTMAVIGDRRGCIYGTKGYAIIENINNFEFMTVYDCSHAKIASYKRPKQRTGYEYEVESCLKALKEGWLQCPQMPHEETIRVMKLMDSLRKEWGVVYPFEENTNCRE